MTHPAPVLAELRSYSRRIPTTMVKRDSVTATYDNRSSAEMAILALARSKYDMRNLSVIGKDHSTEEVVVGFLNPGDSLGVWAKTGAFWGQLTRTLYGSALFVMPDSELCSQQDLSLAGLFKHWKGKPKIAVRTLLGAGLHGIGIPKTTIQSIEKQLKAGKFIVIAQGSPSAIAICRTTLANAEHHSEKADAAAERSRRTP